MRLGRGGCYLFILSTPPPPSEALATREALDRAIAAFERLYRGAPAALAFFDVAGRCVRKNDAFEAWSAGQASGGAAGSGPLDAPRRAVIEGGAAVLSAALAPGGELGSFFPLEVSGELVGVAVVIMAAPAAVGEGQGVAAVEQQRRESAALAFLVEASAALSASLDRQAILDALARVVVAHLATRCNIHLVELGVVTLFTVAASDPDEERHALAYYRQIPFDPAAPQGLAQVIKTGQPEFVPGVGDANLRARARSDDELARLRAMATGSWMVVPIFVRKQVMGGIGFAYRPSSRRYGEADLRVAMEVGRRAGTALENVALYREAQEASRIKDEFLALVSHELRTPLTAIMGWAAILAGDPTVGGEKLGKGLEVIGRNARSQAKIIDDMLDVSRIITGKLKIEPEPVDLAAVLRDARDVLAQAARAKDIDLRLDAPGPFLLVADGERLRQIFWNLLSNAVKFTPRGGWISASLGREAESAVVTVRDSGQGIDPGFLPLAFERFRQMDGSSTRSHGGLGLGLAIVRHLVELHGGDVTAASEGAGKGATFVVRLPIEGRVSEVPRPARAAEGPGGSPEGGHARPGALAGLRLLVVDDQPDARDLIAEMLDGTGASVSLAASSDEAFRLWEALRPDVLITDIAMPGEDGYGLVARLRAAFGDARVIGLSAHARPEDAARARAAGFEAYLSKPLTAAALIDAIGSSCPRREG